MPKTTVSLSTELHVPIASSEGGKTKEGSP
jgi:hypothetical protein